MDGTDEGFEIPEGTEFELNDLWVDFSDEVETDQGGLDWLAQNDLPPNVDGVDYSLGGDYEGGEVLA